MGQVNPVRATTSDTEGGGEIKEAAAFTTLLNEFNGNIDDANLKATYSGYSMYKTLLLSFGGLTSAVANTYLFTNLNGDTSLIASTVSFGSNALPTIYYLDPADGTATGRVTKWRLKGTVLTNATAPAITLTFGLYPVTAVAGGAGLFAVTLGAVVAGSTVAFATPGASSMNQANSGDFTAPTAGYYVPGVVASGSQAANSVCVLSATLQARQT